MAHDLPDLTGQVIDKGVNLAANIEEPKAEPAKTVQEPVLQGLVINPEGNTEVVKSQSEVDDLLASLGF